MNTFAVLFVCVQACLVQSVFSQCLGKYGPAAAIAPGYGPAALGLGYPGGIDFGYPAYPGALGAYPAGVAGCGLEAYGGAGEGNVAVAGELPVAGTTAVAGQVPILGAVTFGGAVPAAGAVTIAGNCACGCGCGAPYLY